MAQRPCVIVNLVIPVPEKNGETPTPKVAREFSVKLIEQIKPIISDALECQVDIDMVEMDDRPPLLYIVENE